MDRQGIIYDQIRTRLKRFSEVATTWQELQNEALRQLSTLEDEGIADTEHEGIYKWTEANPELTAWCASARLCAWMMRQQGWPEWVERECVWRLLREPDQTP